MGGDPDTTNSDALKPFAVLIFLFICIGTRAVPYVVGVGCGIVLALTCPDSVKNSTTAVKRLMISALGLRERVG